MLEVETGPDRSDEGEAGPEHQWTTHSTTAGAGSETPGPRGL
jgi:hypothetical protein